MRKERTEDLERLVGIGRDLERGHDLSSDARTWMRTVERASIDAAVSRTVPSESEAVRKAVARIALQRGWELASIALPSPFVKAEGANGGAGLSAESNGALALSADALASGVPDDDVVLAYVRRGSLARYVEGVANSNAGFAEELRGVIDGLLEAGETVGDAARKWRGLAASREPTSVGVAEAKPAIVVSLEAREKRRRTIFVVQFAVAATLALGVGLYYVQDQRQKAAAVQAAKEKELEEKNAELARMMKDLEKQREIIAQAQAEAKMAQTDMERAEAQAKLAAAIESQRRTQANVAAVRAASSADKVKNHAKAACTCQAGDPLCSCL